MNFWKNSFNCLSPKNYFAKFWRLILLGIFLLFLLTVLGSYFWRGRLPHDIHSTDGDWLPDSRKVYSGKPIIREPNPEEYRSDHFLDQVPRKVLLITIDTLRADHLSIYGYRKKTSPFLDSLAEEGLMFTNTFAPMSKTLPSHVSIMTGLYPIQHNVKTNKLRANSRLTAVPELLEDQGYTTAGFVSTDRHFTPGNLDQGFKTFNNPSPEEQYFSPPGSDADTKFNLSYRPAKKTLNETRNWINSRPPDEKQFIWIHLFDPHFPYAYRPNYHDPIRYGNAERRQDWLQFTKKERGVDLLEAAKPNNPQKNSYISTYRLYDGEIRYVDAQLQSFYNSVTDTWDHAPLSIITSDHGEGMGNHNWWGHSKYAYNEQIQVPLIVHHPQENWDQRITTVTELNDLYATINREANVPYDQALNQKPAPLSFPLQNLISDSDANGFGSAFASRTTFKNEMLDPWQWTKWRWRKLTSKSRRSPLQPEERWKGMTWPGKQYVLLDDSYSYVHNTALRDEFYDQKNDFYQQNNLIDNSKINWRPYGVNLNFILKKLSNQQGPRSESVDQETKQKLKGLGYVN